MAGEPVRVAIIGTGSRAWYMYAPILRGMEDRVALVGVWGRSEASARGLGEKLSVPWYTDIDALISEQRPTVGIVVVGYSGNGEAGLLAVEHGLHVLVETPIAHKLTEADAIIRSARRNGVLVEVAEQFHRRPLAQITLRLISEGIFGSVYSSMNDFAGHGYHGVSLMRSYLGFDRQPRSVTGSVHVYPLAPHHSQIAGTYGSRNETQEHGLVEFDEDRVGIFHWTSVGYDSPLRWWRSSRFAAEKGMGICVGVGMDSEPRLSILGNDGAGPQFITLRREYERCDGGALVAVHADVPGVEGRTVTWSNPFYRGQGVSPQWHDDEIGVAGCLKSLLDAVAGGGEVTYGAEQARLDQELILAIRMSARRGGASVSLPLDPEEADLL